MSTLRPLYDRVVIKRDEAATVSEGGIVIAGEGEQPDIGTVLAAGQGKILEDGSVRPMSVKEGDRVVVAKGTGMETEYDGEPVVIVFEQDIVGVLS